MKPIKIAYIFESYPVFFQPYINFVVNSLKVSAAVVLSIQAFRKNNCESIDANVQYFKGYRTRQFANLLTKIARKKTTLSYEERNALQFDVIHIQHSFLLFKYTSLLKIAKEQRPKIVVTLRGSDTYVKPWINQNYKNFYSEFGNQLDAFVVMSEHQKTYLLRWGVPLERIFVIPISFGDRFEALPKNPNTTELRIVSAFRFIWEKNIDGNLRVIKTLVDMGMSVQYNIYGAGKDEGALYYLVDKYNLTNHVVIKGKIANDELRKKLKAYDFYLQLSHSESLGMSVIEAQTHGVPAVVSNMGGLPEIVVHEKTGFVVASDAVVEAATKIKVLWNDKETYLSYSKAAITHSQEKFNTTKELESLVKLYEKLVTL